MVHYNIVLLTYLLTQDIPMPRTYKRKPLADSRRREYSEDSLSEAVSAVIMEHCHLIVQKISMTFHVEQLLVMLLITNVSATQDC